MHIYIYSMYMHTHISMRLSEYFYIETVSAMLKKYMVKETYDK